MRIPSSEFTPPLTHRGQVTSFFIDDRPVTAYAGETIAAVLLAEDQRIFRRTSQRDEPRSLFCGIGACYDCLVTVDGQATIRACVTAVEEGMRVETEGRGQKSEIGEQKSKVRSTGQGARSSSDRTRRTEHAVRNTEVAVVGAGPAGLEAALVAAETGAQVVLIDSAPRPGGQYFKQPPEAFRVESEQTEASNLFARLNACQSLRLFTGTQVWGAFPGENGDWLLTLHGENAPHRLQTRALILAPGAYDRPIAFPGWTLPGVMTAGAVQTLLKSQAVLPGRRFVLAGSGPLQLLVAAQLVKAGAEVVAVLEANSLSQFISVRYAPAIRGQWARMQQGWSAWRTLRSAGIPIRFGWTMTEARGNMGVEEVRIARLDRNWCPESSTEVTLEADTLVLGYGFLPSTQLTRLLDCEHHFSESHGGWLPLRDERMQTTLPGVYVVGDGAGIGGASLARLEGQVTGLEVAYQLEHISESQRQSQLSTLEPKLKRERRFADLLGELFTPRPGLYSLADDDTIICRCEEVRLRDIRGRCPADAAP